MVTHLLELRRRLFACFAITLALFLVFLIYANTLTQALLSPLTQALPEGSQLISTTVTAPMLVPIHLAFDLALLCAMPLFLFQLWRFVRAGLYAEERQLAGWLLCLSQGLFLTGVGFCFFCVLPFLFSFLMQTAPMGVKVMPDFANGLSLILRMMLIFGLCFQLPVLCVLLVKMGFLTPAQLRAGRPYAVVGAFIVGMLLTPPDVLSQVSLAIPLCGLYELGIVLAGWVGYNVRLRAHSSVG